MSSFGDDVRLDLKEAGVYQQLRSIPERIDVLEDLAEAAKRYCAYPNTVRKQYTARKDMNQLLATLEKM